MLNIPSNDASYVNPNAMTLEKAQSKALILLENYEKADKTDMSQMQAIISQASNIWPLLGKNEKGVKQAVFAIKRNAMNHYDDDALDSLE